MKPALFSVLLSLSTLQLPAMEFPVEYVPEQLPQEAPMPWRIWKADESTATAAIVNKTLHVEAKSNERFCYMMGTYDGDKQAGFGDKGWAVLNGKTTVEFSVKCDAADPSADIFGVSVSDGATTWTIQFSTTEIRIPGKPKEVNTTKPDTYTISISDGKCQLSSARHGLLFDDIKGTTGGEKISNRITFGTVGGKRNIGHNVSWDLSFIRWNNSEAVMAPPPKDKGR